MNDDALAGPCLCLVSVKIKNQSLWAAKCRASHTGDALRVPAVAGAAVVAVVSGVAIVDV